MKGKCIVLMTACEMMLCRAQLRPMQCDAMEEAAGQEWRSRRAQSRQRAEEAQARCVMQRTRKRALPGEVVVACTSYVNYSGVMALVSLSFGKTCSSIRDICMEGKEW